MSAKYKSPSFLLPNELNTSANTANDTGINSLYSMEFDGTNQTIATSYYWPTGNTAKSISLWFYKDSGDATLIGGGQNSAGKYFGMSSFSYLNRFKFDINPSINFSNNSAAIGQWQHIVVTAEPTVNDTILRGYVDGVLDSNFPHSVANGTPANPTTVPGGINTGSTVPVTIGENNVLNFNKFPNGKIDEVAIFNRTLNTTEIAALYEGTSPNIKPSNLMAANLNPVAYYPLGEQAQNTGYLDPNNPGSDISGSEWQFPNGVLQDYVMDFDGSNDCVQINTINLGTTFTASAWINPSGYGGAVLGGNDNNAYVFLIGGANSVTVKFGGGYNVYTTSTISTGQWYHLAFIRTGTSGELFINGVSQGSSSLSLGSVNFEFEFIGSRSTNTQLFNGKISNVAIWNTDQSANIANIYNNGSPQTTYTVTPQNWWKLNADSVYTPSAPNYTTALNFNGTTGVTTAGITGIAASNSISFWFNNSIAAGGQAPLVASLNYTSSSGENFAIRLETTNKLTVVLVKNGTFVVLNSNTVLSDNNWYFITLTTLTSGSNVTTTLYINETQDLTATATNHSNLSDLQNGLTIGYWTAPGGETYNFNGSISNVAIYNTALSASNISTLFNFGTPETSISFSPTGWWKLDNTTTGIQDSSGNGNNATNNSASEVSSGVAFTPSWKIPTALTIQTPSYTQALDFNNLTGYTDSIAYGSSFSDVPSASGAHTFSLWFKQDALNSNQERLFATKAGHGAFAVWIDNGTLKWSVYDGGSRVVSTSVQAGIWYNIVFGVNGSNETFLYLNNGPKISTAYSGTIAYQGVETGIYLGRGRDTAANRSFNGQLSNFAWFNYVLPETGTESVQSIYNLGTPKDITGWSNNYLWYKLNSLTITDSSGNNRTGVNSNATLISSDVLATQPVNGVSTTLPSTALQQSDLQFDSPYSNYSLKFSTSQSIDTNFTLPASYTSYSYSFWYRSTAASLGTGDYYIISNFDSSNTNLSGTRGAVRFNNSTKMRIFGGDNTNYYLRQYEVGSSLLDQQWHNVIVTFTNTEVLLYIDGVSISAETTTNTPITGFAANRSYTIGQSGINSGYLINSKLDEFAIFNKKLTEAEILSIYNNGKPGDISTLSPTNWWRLGENAYFVNNDITLPNSVSGAPNGVSSGTATSMLSADAPGTYANGVGSNLDIIDRVGDAALSVANSQSYNMIPDDKIPYVPGYVGDQISNTYSMAFDGINDYFNANGSVLPTGNSSFTASCWFKRNGAQANYAGILSWGTTSQRENVYINFASGGTSLKFGFYSDDLASSGYYATNNSEWYNVVLTYNGSVAKMYINGSFQASHTLGGALNISSSNPITIGKTNTYYFKGEIDEVAIFDKALTADQVKFDLYKPTSTTTGKTADIANNPNLPTPVAWYRMGD